MSVEIKAAVTFGLVMEIPTFVMTSALLYLFTFFAADETAVASVWGCISWGAFVALIRAAEMVALNLRNSEQTTDPSELRHRWLRAEVTATLTLLVAVFPVMVLAFANVRMAVLFAAILIATMFALTAVLLRPWRPLPSQAEMERRARDRREFHNSRGELS